MADEIIILGDPHIGGGVANGKLAIGAALNSRVVDQINLLDYTLDQAVLRGVETIIITGDVFEEPKPAPSLITLFISWLKRCAANDVYVHIIVGNHDILRTGNFYTSPLDIISECQLDNVSVHKEINTVFMGTTAFTFLPFRDRKSFGVESNAEALILLANNISYEVASIPSIYQKILIGHLAIEGSLPVGDEIDDLTNELFCPLELLRSYDYVWMGHIHKPQTLNHNPHIAHIGSMDISNYGETDQQKYLICYDLEKKNFERIVLPTRPLYKISISVPKETKDTTRYVLEQIAIQHSSLAKAIVRVEIHLASHDLPPANRVEIEQYLYDLGAFNVSAISESKKLAPIKKDAETGSISPAMDVSAAIRLWAETQLDPENQAKFIETAISIYKELNN
jgi:DNA repair exonuclease SbcCD nuclease subunit